MSADNMFKGYIPTKGKRPIEKYKDRNDYVSYEWARKLDEYAGVLHDDIVQIDVDDADQAEIVRRIVMDRGLNCNILKTERGLHFYFKNVDLDTRKIKTPSAIGIKIDIGLGSKNGLVPLKIAGKKRQWIQETDHLDELPKFLYPVKSTVDFLNMSEGDGRNQALFNYILTLQSHGFSKDEITQTIEIINAYVLKKPLDKRELEVILREDAFKKPSFFRGNTFLHHEFAKFLAREHHLVKINNVLHIYNDGIYSDDPHDIEAAMIKHIPHLTQSRRKEVMAYLEIIAERVEMSPVNLVALSNGIYDLNTGSILPYSPDVIIKNRIPVSYDPSAYDHTLDQTLNKIACGDKELRLLLEEVVGYILLRRNELGKSFILTGTGSNGKSTFLDIIKHFLGADNYSSLALDELGARFKTAELFGKLANLGDDISNQYIENNAIFKKLVTGETTNVERKGRDPFDFNNYAKIIFSANEIPRINDTTDGLMRRLVIIPFNAKFSNTDADFDPFIKDKLLTDSAMRYLLNLAIEGLKRVLARKAFTIPESVHREMRQYEEINNPVVAFLHEDPKIHQELSRDVYLKYATWCHENGLRPLSHVQFARELCKHGVESKVRKINGKAQRIFIVTDGYRRLQEN